MISVIVACYNIEKYVYECINSLINQDYQDFEIIIINDGSTDNTENEIKKIDSERIRYYKIENSGPSYARNYGIERAYGDYLVFVDGDDIVDRRYLRILWETIGETNTRIGVVKYKKFCKKPTLSKEKRKKKKISSKKFIKQMFLQKRNIACWGKIYEKSMFDSIKFPNGSFYEDMSIMDRLLFQTDFIGITNDISYFYRVNDTGIMHSPTSTKKYNDMENVSNELLGRFSKTKLEKSCIVRVAVNYMTIIHRNTMVDERDKKNIKFIKKNFFKIMFSNTTLKVKLATLYFCLKY